MIGMYVGCFLIVDLRSVKKDHFESVELDLRGL